MATHPRRGGAGTRRRRPAARWSRVGPAHPWHRRRPSSSARSILQHTPSDEGTLVAQAARPCSPAATIYGVAWPQLFVAAAHPGHLDDGRRSRLHVRVPAAGGPADRTGARRRRVPGSRSRSSRPRSCWSARSCCGDCCRSTGGRAATAVMLGFPFMPHYARLGYPAVIAMVWLIPVIIRWPAIGARRPAPALDVVRAACLGAACATQQLAWFVAPFLLVGCSRCAAASCRRAERSTTVAAFAGIAAAVCLAIDCRSSSGTRPAWASGVALVLTQHAIPHGQGLIDVSFYLTDGSGAWTSIRTRRCCWRSGCSLVSAIWVRRLGPALTGDPVVGLLPVRSLAGRLLPADDAALARRRRDRTAVGLRTRLATAHLIAPRIDRQPCGPCGRWRRGYDGSHAARGDAPGAGTPVRDRRDRQRRAARADRHRHELACVARAGSLADRASRCSIRSTVALAPHSRISTGQGITPFWSRNRRPCRAGAPTSERPIS